MNMYSIGLYYDQDTKRNRWAVFCSITHTWIFPTRYGRLAAEKLCNKLNKGKL